MGTLKVIGSALYQWEIGRKIRIDASVGNRAVEVQFAHPGDKEALSVIPKEENGIIVAEVPNIMLQSADKLIVFLVEMDENCVETTRHSVFHVVNRPKPADYLYTETEILSYRTLEQRIDQIEKNGVSDEQIATAVGKYLDENPSQGGANEEEKAQIQQNKTDIEQLAQDKLDASALPEAVNEALAEAKESGEFKGEPGQPGPQGEPGPAYELTEADKTEIAEQAAGMVEVPEGGTVTDEQIASAVEDYFEENPVIPGATVEPAVEDIPKVFFGGEVQQTKDEVIIPFRYISKTLDLSCYAKIKAQGDSSMLYPKKNQTIKLYKDSACTEKQKVDFRGWGKQSKFVLKANWTDLSHARNLVSARIWGDVVKSRAEYTALSELLRTSPNQGAVDGFPIKLYANGVYQGRYTLNIPKDAWMANMDDELDEHCILCSENYKSSCFREAAVINGDDWSDEVHDTVPESIKTRWNEVISFVRNSTDEDFKNNLKNYLYVDSLIDYYIFGLVACDLDGYGKNQVYFTYDGNRWFASLYDKDPTWGLYWNGGRFVPYDYSRGEYEDFVNGQGNLLYIRLAALFGDEIKARYNELKAGALSIPNIINHFERFMDVCPLDLVKEDYASTTGGGAFTAIPSQNTNNIQQIRDYLVNRYKYVDTLLNPALCTGITLSATELTFTAIGKQMLIATLVPADTTEVLTWESSNESVATVSNGEVTAVGDGEAVITARCGSQSAMCRVAVSGTAGGVLYPLADGSKAFTEGIALEVTNGNHVKISSSKWVSSVYLNLSDVASNSDSAVATNNHSVASDLFTLNGNTIVFCKKNTTSTKATGFNSKFTLLGTTAKYDLTAGTVKTNEDTTSTKENVSGSFGGIGLFIQGIDTGETLEFDIELFVDGVQYI